MANPTERRKADRKRMSEELFAIASQYDLAGITLTKEGEDLAYLRAAIVELTTKRGLACRFEFDGESCQPDVYVNAWHMILDTDACLSDRFPGSVNHAHFRKSTTVCEGFAALCAHVVAVLEGDKAGWIYSEAREAAHVAKNGTWQEQKTKWDAYFAERQSGELANG
jgi:hypothetical protein